MKKAKWIIGMFLFLLLPVGVQAREKVPVYIFKSITCPHCANAIAFFEQLEKEYGKYYELIVYETSDSSENRELMQQVTTVLHRSTNAVPFIVIGNEAFVGYSTAKDAVIKNAIMEEYNRSTRYDVMDHLNDEFDESDQPEEQLPEIPIEPEENLDNTQKQQEGSSFWIDMAWIGSGILAILVISILLVIQKKRHYHV